MNIYNIQLVKGCVLGNLALNKVDQAHAGKENRKLKKTDRDKLYQIIMCLEAAMEPNNALMIAFQITLQQFLFAFVLIKLSQIYSDSFVTVRKNLINLNLKMICDLQLILDIFLSL